MRILLLLVGVDAFLRRHNRTKIHAKQSDDSEPSMMRHWYICSGSEFEEPTDEEKAIGIETANHMCCTRELTFTDLCCMDFDQIHMYQTPNSGAPYDDAFCVDLALDAAQLPAGAPGAMIDDLVDAHAQGQIQTICTSEVPAVEILEGEGGGDAQIPNQACSLEEFSDEDMAAGAGATMLDFRIMYLEKQGLPGSAIPVCWQHMKKIGMATCPNGNPPNSASDVVLERIGKKRPVAMIEQSEDELAAMKENKAEAGPARSQRTYVRTLRKYAGLTADELKQEFPAETRFSFMNKDQVYRMTVHKATGGAGKLELEGDLNGSQVRLELSGSKAELKGATVQELDLDGVVLSSLGHGSMAAAGMRGRGGAHGGGSSGRGRGGGGFLSSPGSISLGGGAAGAGF